MRRIHIVLLAGLLTVVATVDSAAQSTKDKLQGTWVRVGGVHDGKRMSASAVREVTLNITGNRFTIKQGDTVINEGLIRLGKTGTPRTIDLRPNGAKGDVLRGILRFTKTGLVTCFGAAGADRPASFVAEDGSGASLFTWRRESSSPAAPEPDRSEKRPRASMRARAPSGDESPVTDMLRALEMLPTASALMQGKVTKAGSPEFEFETLLTKMVAYAETYMVAVNGRKEPRTRTRYKPVFETVTNKGLVKDLRVITAEGKLATVSADDLKSVLRAGAPIVLGCDIAVAAKCLSLYKPGTLVLVPGQGVPIPPSPPDPYKGAT